MDDGKHSRWPMIAITLMRVFGMALPVEGIAKLSAPAWSAAGYLKASRGPFSAMFKSIAARPNLLDNVNLITGWGLRSLACC
jgi:hypothetical protein